MMHYSSINQVVRKERLELSRTRTPASKAGVSAFHHFRILALRSANRTFSAYFALLLVPNVRIELTPPATETAGLQVLPLHQSSISKCREMRFLGLADVFTIPRYSIFDYRR